MAISPKVDADKVAAGLSLWAQHHGPVSLAAVVLLIQYGWHRDPMFRQVMCAPESEPDWCAIRWEQARDAFDRGKFADEAGGSHAHAALDFALALGEDRYELASQAPAAAQNMMAAFCTAIGVVPTSFTRLR
jgi:hypothetical protein